MANVVLQNISKVFDDTVTAVDEATLEVADKEFVVLVGPSGCGKSTTLRMIAGLEDVTSGEISIDGRTVNDVPPKDRDIAMVFQNYALYPHMSVYDNMAFGLKLRKFPKDEIEERVRGAAEILGIDDLLERKPKALSGGQRQRVAVGRAIVRQPKVFLFDEPLSNLDAKFRVAMRTEISKLHTRLEATMIYVTHDQVEAMTMGDQVVVMDQGKIQQIDSPLNLYERPVNRFVAGFIGSPAMNFLEGTIERNGGLAFRDKYVRHAIGPDHDDVLVNLVDQGVTLGIRPESFSLSQTDATLSVQIEVVEPMGNETFLYVKVGDQSVVARVGAGHAAHAGQTMDIGVDLSKARFFDQQSGDAL
ncbi:MAG: sn-glycerol-3-phosphate ABC transporter ATP-binding protein UgpC [Candidatus Latescibacteria bacterium]|nr:sn-glycerol-3-phosphate ABC transporter ATP-binding protein UgpC [Candidatus Latescibacterota bacterium]